MSSTLAETSSSYLDNCQTVYDSDSQLLVLLLILHNSKLFVVTAPNHPDFYLPTQRLKDPRSQEQVPLLSIVEDLTCMWTGLQSQDIHIHPTPVLETACHDPLDPAENAGPTYPGIFVRVDVTTSSDFVAVPIDHLVETVDEGRSLNIRGQEIKYEVTWIGEHQVRAMNTQEAPNLLNAVRSAFGIEPRRSGYRKSKSYGKFQTGSARMRSGSDGFILPPLPPQRVQNQGPETRQRQQGPYSGSAEPSFRAQQLVRPGNYMNFHASTGPRLDRNPQNQRSSTATQIMPQFRPLIMSAQNPMMYGTLATNPNTPTAANTTFYQGVPFNPGYPAPPPTPFFQAFPPNLAMQAAAHSIECTLCGGIGHLASDCLSPFRQYTCKRCRDNGHHQERCPNMRCYDCGEYTHWTSRCPNPVNWMAGRCTNCFSKDHFTAGCPQPQRKQLREQFRPRW